MKELDDLSYESIVRYFHTLSIFGYKSYSEVYKLLLLLFLTDLINGPLGFYIDSCDYRYINRLLYKLYGSTCLIPYPDYNRSTELVQILNTDVQLRLSETGSSRLTEGNIVRLV